MITPLPPVDPNVQELIDVVRKQMEAQPWYLRFSNTVTTAAGAILAILWLAAASGLEIPTDVTKWVTAVIVVLTVLGVIKTPNGVTPSQVDQLETVATYTSTGRHARLE